jgi:hypothetical protein
MSLSSFVNDVIKFFENAANSGDPAATQAVASLKQAVSDVAAAELPLIDAGVNALLNMIPGASAGDAAADSILNAVITALQSKLSTPQAPAA